MSTLHDFLDEEKTYCLSLHGTGGGGLLLEILLVGHLGIFKKRLSDIYMPTQQVALPKDLLFFSIKQMLFV